MKPIRSLLDSKIIYRSWNRLKTSLQHDVIYHNSNNKLDLYQIADVIHDNIRKIPRRTAKAKVLLSEYKGVEHEDGIRTKQYGV